MLGSGGKYRNVCISSAVKKSPHCFYFNRLDGHEYGGQCVVASSVSGLLYTASMDFSLKSWSLEEKCLKDSKTDHCDYVQSIVVHPM